MAPSNLAGLVVNCLDYTLAPNVIVRAGPAVDSVRGLGEVDAPAGMSVDDKQSSLRVEAGRSIVGQAALVGSDEAAIRRRFLCWVGNRTALLVDPERPVHRAIGNGKKALSICPIEDEEISIARRLHQHLFRLAVEISIDEHRSFHGIPVVRVVW